MDMGKTVEAGVRRERLRGIERGILVESAA